MKVLFLDHDGVICLASEWGSRFKNQEGLDSHFDRFNDKAVDVLNEVIDETDCEIVVSSDWKYHSALETMQEIYRIRGIKKAPIDYTSQVLDNSDIPEGFTWIRHEDLEQTRSLEIKKWLREHPEVTAWCSVDDLHMGIERLSYGRKIERDWGLSNFVWTPNSREGIKQTGVKEKIVDLLGKK
jgi:hypothetical protein